MSSGDPGAQSEPIGLPCPGLACEGPKGAGSGGQRLCPGAAGSPVKVSGGWLHGLRGHEGSWALRQLQHPHGHEMGAAGGEPGRMSEANNKYCCRKVLFPTLCSD